MVMLAFVESSIADDVESVGVSAVAPWTLVVTVAAEFVWQSYCLAVIFAVVAFVMGHNFDIRQRVCCFHGISFLISVVAR